MTYEPWPCLCQAEVRLRTWQSWKRPFAGQTGVILSPIKSRKRSKKIKKEHKSTIKKNIKTHRVATQKNFPKRPLGASGLQDWPPGLSRAEGEVNRKERKEHRDLRRGGTSPSIPLPAGPAPFCSADSAKRGGPCGRPLLADGHHAPSSCGNTSADGFYKATGKSALRQSGSTRESKWCNCKLRIVLRPGRPEI